jgi:glycosyltransferase involved in cell wall biosynthesis
MEEKARPKQILADSRRLMYLNAEVGSVFDSQVVELLRYLNASADFSEIILLCGFRNQAEKDKILQSVKGSGFQLELFQTYPSLPIFTRLQTHSIKRSLQKLGLHSKDLIHVRGELLFLAALPALKSLAFPFLRVLVDIRGAGREELIDFQKPHPFIEYFKLRGYSQAYKALQQAGKISVVSSSLANYVSKNTGLKESTFSVVPCLAGESFSYNPEEGKRLRRAEGIAEDACVLIFSSGGSAAWQENDAVQHMCSPQWQILNMSRLPIEGENIIHRFVPYHEVPRWLNAADAAILFRSPSVVNAVACPVKFCEYLCAGLPVIANTEVDLVTDWIHTHKAGFLLKQPGDIQQFSRKDFLQLSGKDIAEAAQAVFGVKAVVRQYIKIYNEL